VAIIHRALVLSTKLTVRLDLLAAFSCDGMASVLATEVVPSLSGLLVACLNGAFMLAAERRVLQSLIDAALACCSALVVGAEAVLAAPNKAQACVGKSLDCRTVWDDACVGVAC
jgi:hypothetical protein